MVSCHHTTLSLVQVILQAAATNRQQLPAHLLARLEAEKGGAEEQGAEGVNKFAYWVCNCPSENK